ncbi:MAG: polyprenyl synthetase family protein [Beijerinckiaceae bacterium]
MANIIPSEKSLDLLKARLSIVADRTEQQLESILVDAPSAGERMRPPLLLEAMRYTVLGGGKRIRPFLVVETARMLGLETDGPLRAGAALELIHCYSLVHDDLPAMDNDDLRRGKPTVHKAYDDAMAVLVGDALLTLAFDVVADKRTSSKASVQTALVRILARGAGQGGMVGGQLLDLAAEGRYRDRMAPANAEAAVVLIQSMKTGALIMAGCQLGAVLAGASVKQKQAIDAYGSALGLAFQIKDDLLDVESDASTVGKATGKDAAAGKATFVSLYGVEGARQRLMTVTAEGKAAIRDFGDKGATLSALLDFNVSRKT